MKHYKRLMIIMEVLDRSKTLYLKIALLLIMVAVVIAVYKAEKILPAYSEYIAVKKEIETGD